MFSYSSRARRIFSVTLVRRLPLTIIGVETFQNSEVRKVDTDIRDSVGDVKKGAINRIKDVETVQGLLNVQVVKDRGSARFVAVDGRVGSETLHAIGEFQRGHSLALTGLIRSGDATIRALASFSGPSSMRASSDLVHALEGIEKFSATPYDDAERPTSNATIGFGRKLHSGKVTDADRKKWGPKGISRTRAEGMLRQDIGGTEHEINTDVRVPLRQNQFDALVSLTLNIGNEAFRNSTLVRLLNRGDYEGAANEFPHWERSGSAHPKGLLRRPRDEQERFRRR